MSDTTIAPKLWQEYDAQRQRRIAVDAVVAELETAITANPALLPVSELLLEWRALEHAFPDQPLDVSIAVIGVFRGGKSTLINALLGANLLPAAHVATTATITQVRHRPEGYVVRVRYTGPQDQGFTAARADLLALFQRPLEDVLHELRDLNARGPVESLLGMYGAIGEHGALLEDRVSRLHAEAQRAGALPALPHEKLLGKIVEHRHENLATLEDAVRPYVMFTGATGEFDLDAAIRQFMIASVTIEGPFDVLASPRHGAGALTLVDTPGLEDPRPFVKRMVHDYLRAADCVCLNLSHGGVISEADVEVLRLLLSQSLQRKLIITLGKIDNLGTDEEGVRRQVEKQRSALQVRVTELHQGDAAEARRFVDDTPILPVVALAALQRAQHERGLALDKYARRRLEDYPTGREDGTQALFEQIRATLDGSSRLRAVVNRAEETLSRVVTSFSVALGAGIEDRQLSAGQLQAKVAELKQASEESQRALKAELDSKLIDARQQWARRRQEDRERFDAKLADVALRQIVDAREFVKDATADEWKHWRRLRAVADAGDFDGGYDSMLRDDIAHYALGGVPVLLRTAIGALLDSCTESVGSAADLTSEIVKSFGDASGGIQASQIAEVQIALQGLTGAELRAATSEYRSQMNALAAEVFERNAVEKMSLAATTIVKQWISRVERDGGRGVQARMHAALEDVMTRYVAGLREHVREMFGADIERLFRAAEEGALGVYERVANAATRFLSERLAQLEEAALRAQTMAADSLDAERALLETLRDRLESAARIVDVTP